MYNNKPCFYLIDFVFKGDEFLNENYWNKVRKMLKQEGRKGNPEYEGIVLVKNAQGIMEGKRNIRLEQ